MRSTTSGGVGPGSGNVRRAGRAPARWVRRSAWHAGHAATWRVAGRGVEVAEGLEGGVAHARPPSVSTGWGRRAVGAVGAGDIGGTSGRGVEVPRPQQPGERCPPSGAARLDRALGDVEHLGGLAHRHRVHVDEHERLPLVLGQPGQRGTHVERGLGAVVGVNGVRRLLLGQRDRGPRLAPPHAVEAGVDDDAVQPRRDGRVATEPVGPAIGRHERVLQRVGGLLAVAERAQRDGPQPVAMTAHQLTERVAGRPARARPAARRPTRLATAGPAGRSSHGHLGDLDAEAAAHLRRPGCTRSPAGRR